MSKKPEDVDQGAWDAAVAMWQRGRGMDDVARAIMAAVEAEREACARLIDEGFDRVGIVTKHDQCPHNLYGWEDCEQCAAAAIRKRAQS